ncbi:MAG: hypothetical protein Q7U47_15355 [Paludibacter sp.]|nr:hypothetical protein [Paludibacter sp.]
MKRITLLFFLLASINAFAQKETLTKDDLVKELQPFKTTVQTLQNENSKLKSEVSYLKKQLSSVNKSVDNLQTQMQTNSNAISQTANELGIKISATETNTNNKITEVGKMLSKNSLYGIIAVLCAIILSGLLYWLLSKRQKIDKIQLSNIIKNTKTELTQESAKLDIQLLDVIEKQLKIADKLNAAETTVDHTFHKNSANELQRIANYTNTLDTESQEAIALQGSLGRLRNYFNASDYEINDFTGKEYDDRIPMRIRETIFDDSIAIGKEIVIKTWEPQIKFKNEIIQKAKIDTKYNK